MIDIKNDISNYSDDSRLTAPNDGQKYNLKEMIKTSEKLGRPLSNSEAEKFRIKEWTTMSKQSAEQDFKNKLFKALSDQNPDAKPDKDGFLVIPIRKRRKKDSPDTPP